MKFKLSNSLFLPFQEIHLSNWPSFNTFYPYSNSTGEQVTQYSFPQNERKDFSVSAHGHAGILLVFPFVFSSFTLMNEKISVALSPSFVLFDSKFLRGQLLRLKSIQSSSCVGNATSLPVWRGNQGLQLLNNAHCLCPQIFVVWNFYEVLFASLNLFSHEYFMTNFLRTKVHGKWSLMAKQEYILFLLITNWVENQRSDLSRCFII